MAVPECATFSNTAQTRLLLCKFPEELHFSVTTFEINHIIFLVFLGYLCYRALAIAPGSGPGPQSQFVFNGPGS